MNYERLTNEELQKYCFPNLVAELIESHYSVCALGSHMGIGDHCKEDDPEVWGRLKGDIEVMASEMIGAARLFRCKADYLFSCNFEVLDGLPLAYWRWREKNKRREKESKENNIRWDIERELRDKPYRLDFMKEMLTANENERQEVLRLLADLRKREAM